MAESSAFAERCAQLIADFQHAMDDAAPVNAVLMTELKAVLGLGVQARADSDGLHAKMTALRPHAEYLAKILSTEGTNQ